MYDSVAKYSTVTSIRLTVVHSPSGNVIIFERFNFFGTLFIAETLLHMRKLYKKKMEIWLQIVGNSENMKVRGCGHLKVRFQNFPGETGNPQFNHNIRHRAEN